MANPTGDGYPPPQSSSYTPTAGYIASRSMNSSTEKIRNFNVFSAFALVTQQFFMVLSGLMFILPPIMGVKLFEITNGGIASPVVPESADPTVVDALSESPDSVTPPVDDGSVVAPFLPQIEVTDSGSVIVIVAVVFAVLSLLSLFAAFGQSIMGLIVSAAYKIVGLMVFIVSGLEIAGIIYLVVNLAELAKVMTIV